MQQQALETAPIREQPSHSLRIIKPIILFQTAELWIHAQQLMDCLLDMMRMPDTQVELQKDGQIRAAYYPGKTDISALKGQWEIRDTQDPTCHTTCDPRVIWSPDFDFDCSNIFRKVKASLKKQARSWRQSLGIHFGNTRFLSGQVRFQILLNPKIRVHQFLELRGFEIQVYRSGTWEISHDFLPINQLDSWLEVLLNQFSYAPELRSYQQFSNQRATNQKLDIALKPLPFPLARCFSFPDCKRSADWIDAFEIWLLESVREQRQKDFYSVSFLLPPLRRDGLSSRLHIPFLEDLSKVLGLVCSPCFSFFEDRVYLSFCRKAHLPILFDHVKNWVYA